MSSAVASLTSSYEHCFELFCYDPESGNFLTKKQTTPLYPIGKVRAPIEKHTSKGTGRLVMTIKVDGVHRRASHLAYLLMTGKHLPKGWAIFYKDGDFRNLKWANLVAADLKCGGIF